MTFSETKLDAATSRLTFNLDRMTRYFEAVGETVTQSGDEKVHQFFLQTIVVMLLAFIEEYFSSLVSLAAYHQQAVVRAYFSRYGSPEKKARVAAGCDAGELMRLAEAECSFKSDAKRLKRVFDALFGIEPFPDQTSEDLIHDLCVVRNVIAHRGGWPSQDYAKQMRVAGVIVVSAEIDMADEDDEADPALFYRLDLKRTTFFQDVFKAARAIAVYVQRNLKKDPRYSLVLRR